jgi:hypothetical protein
LKTLIERLARYSSILIPGQVLLSQILAVGRFSFLYLGTPKSSYRGSESRLALSDKKLLTRKRTLKVNGQRNGDLLFNGLEEAAFDKGFEIKLA